MQPRKKSAAKVKKSALKAKAKAAAKSGGKTKKKEEEPTDVGPFGFDDEGEEEDEAVDEPIEHEAPEVTRKRKEPIAPPEAALAPAKAPKSEHAEPKIAPSQPAEPTDGKVAEEPADGAAAAAAPMGNATPTSIPVKAAGAEIDTQDGTQWILGSKFGSFFMHQLSNQICKTLWPVKTDDIFHDHW